MRMHVMIEEAPIQPGPAPRPGLVRTWLFWWWPALRYLVGFGLAAWFINGWCRRIPRLANWFAGW